MDFFILFMWSFDTFMLLNIIVFSVKYLLWFCSDPHPTNAEVKTALTGSRGAMTSSLAYQSPWVNPNPGQRTMADIVKMGRPLHQENVVVPRSSSETQESGSKAPLKDAWPTIEKQDVSYLSSSLLKPSAESSSNESQHLDDTHLDDTHLDDEVSKTKTNPTVSPPDTHHHGFEENGGENVILCLSLFPHFLHLCPCF